MWLLWLLVFSIGFFIIYKFYTKIIKPKLDKMEVVNEEVLKKSKDDFKSKVKEAEQTAKKSIKDGKSLLKKVKEIK